MRTRAQRAGDAERHARALGLRRDRSQRAIARLGRCALPGERPGHQATTAHFQAVYPAVAEAGLGARGVYIGRDMHGGSFVYDPWVLYARGILNDANTLVIGRPDFGKSSLSKTWLLRSRVFGRRGEIVDLKGEYDPLVNALGGTILRLTPGGGTRLNPLTRIGRRELREGLLEAIARAMLGRPLSQAEAIGLSAALEEADRRRDGAEVCIPDVIEELRAPASELADRLGAAKSDVQTELREVALALQRLCHGPLRGMFDGPTTAGEDVFDAPVISLDLSEIADGVAAVNLPIAIAMVCAVAFLDAKRIERAERARASGRELEKTIRINDEAWRALPIAGLGDYYQAAFKLSRKTGVQHWLVLHRISDLRAAGDEGTRQQRLAEGLLADASTTIVYRKHAQEVALTTDALGLSATERQLIGSLDQGVALWRAGGRSFEVRHLLSDLEWELIDTDQAMGSRRDQPRAEATA
ncbi:MAG: ATP-binding protein [Solirubrobacteraceae bacterium]